MKKMLSLIIITSILTAHSVSFADNEITVTIDGNPVEFDVQPTIINGRTMVPMRAIFESLGALVVWDEKTTTALGTKCGIALNFPIGKNTITKNTIELDIDTPATIIDGRTLLPVRAVAESFGMDVNWNEATHTVQIDSTNNLGTYYLDNGLVYKGELVLGLPNGYGTFFDNGSPIFMGISADFNYMKGTCFLEDGTKYNGEFSNNIPNGDGSFFYANKDMYLGTVKNGVPDGWGKYVWANDQCYIGGWSNGEYDGYGTFYDSYGHKLTSGFWSNGEIVKYD